MTNRTPLNGEAEAVARTRSVIATLEQRRQEVHTSLEVGMVLQACLGTAVIGMDAYLVLSRAEKSLIRPRDLAEARLRCDGSLRKLQRRVARLMARLCRHMDGADLVRMAEYAVSLRT